MAENSINEGKIMASTYQYGKSKRSMERFLRRLPGRTALYTAMALLSIIFGLPLIWMISTSLKTGPEAFRLPPDFIPNPIVWMNYINGLSYLPFIKFILNTMIITLPRIVGAVGVSALVAYGFSRIEWDGRDTLFFICVATMVIPFAVTMIPLYLLFHHFGWIGTYLPLIVPSMFAEPYFIFLLRQFFMGIPQELSDAARVDGCSELMIFWQIILPLSKPVLAVVALFQFMWTWGDYMGPLIYLNDPNKFTVSLGLYQFGISWRGATLDRYTWFMAAITAMTLPVLILFFLVQRTFIEGISLTGLKG
jgi:multiple sugar transport system permease protein